MKKIILTATFLFSICLAFSQGLLKHYERKASFDHIFLPFETFNSSDYRIVYHDSVYNAADITIKKAKIKEVKKIGLKLSVSQHTYNSVELTTKSFKRFEQLKTILADAMSCTPDKFGANPYVDKTKNIRVVIKRAGRRNTLVLSQAK